MSPATMRARMSRPLDAMRVFRREKALTELSTVHTRWIGVPNYYARRCARQGYPIETTPADLARFEVRNEMQAELLNGEVG